MRELRRVQSKRLERSRVFVARELAARAFDPSTSPGIVLGPHDCLCKRHRAQMYGLSFAGVMTYVTYNGVAVAGPFVEMCDAEAWARRHIPVSPFCRHEAMRREPTLVPG
jgi:hypothetical protein